MDSHTKNIFLEKIVEECDNCLSAADKMNKFLVSQVAEDQSTFFKNMKDFLIHTAAISKMFWPAKNSPKKTRGRCKSLLKIIGLDEKHILKDRKFRNHFEHYDERLDKWDKTSTNHTFIRDYIGPRSSIGGTAVEDTDIFSLFDPETNLFYFRGDTVNIQEMITSIIQIKERAKYILVDHSDRKAGYRDLSLIRASSVVKRQSTPI